MKNKIIFCALCTVYVCFALPSAEVPEGASDAQVLNGAPNKPSQRGSQNVHKLTPMPSALPGTPPFSLAVMRYSPSSAHDSQNTEIVHSRNSSNASDPSPSNGGAPTPPSFSRDNFDEACVVAAAKKMAAGNTSSERGSAHLTLLSLSSSSAASTMVGGSNKSSAQTTPTSKVEEPPMAPQPAVTPQAPLALSPTSAQKKETLRAIKQINEELDKSVAASQTPHERPPARCCVIL